jgi:hypothetical protein
MIEIYYNSRKMEAQGKVWDGKNWVKQTTIFKRAVREAKKQKSIYKQR